MSLTMPELTGIREMLKRCSDSDLIIVDLMVLERKTEKNIGKVTKYVRNAKNTSTPDPEPRDDVQYRDPMWNGISETERRSKDKRWKQNEPTRRL